MGDINDTSEYYTVSVTEEELQEYPCEPTLFVRFGGIYLNGQELADEALYRSKGEGRDRVSVCGND